MERDMRMMLNPNIRDFVLKLIPLKTAREKHCHNHNKQIALLNPTNL